MSDLWLFHWHENTCYLFDFQIFNMIFFVLYNIFLQREPKQKFTASDKGKIVLSGIRKVINSRFPELFDKLNILTDSRNRREYSMCEIITGGLFLFIFKESSRNSYNNDRREENFRKNFYRYFGFNLPHADAIEDVLRKLPPEQLETLKAQLVSSLIEQKIFRKFRFLGKYYLIAVDGTGIASFDHKHCKHCLTKTSKKGVVTYFHYVLEAKIVTSNGLAISIASEFIENPAGGDYEKQDCEQKAFVRLADKIKKFFPRLEICILADGLYPNNTVFEICKKNNWAFIITLKEGCLKTFNREVELLRATAKGREVFRADKTSRTFLKYLYLNNIEYGKNSYSWVECTETTIHKNKKTQSVQRFVYITNNTQSIKTVITTADSGRLRWKVENEGFNTQKNLGYELEHKYSRVSYTAMQNYYQLCQIAHAINQFVERLRELVLLIKEHSKQTISDIWKKTLAYMIMTTVPDIQLSG
jgi:hypothetical protein